MRDSYTIKLQVSAEFIALCAADGFNPAAVLAGFAADVSRAEGHGNDDDMNNAEQYYEAYSGEEWPQMAADDAEDAEDAEGTLTRSRPSLAA